MLRLSTTANSSSFFDESSCNEIPLLLFHLSTQANFFTALQHFLSSIGHHHPLSSLASSSLSAHLLFQLVFTQSTASTGLHTVNCFNWTPLSQLLQLVFTESTASPGLHFFKCSFRPWHLQPEFNVSNYTET